MAKPFQTSIVITSGICFLLFPIQLFGVQVYSLSNEAANEVFDLDSVDALIEKLHPDIDDELRIAAAAKLFWLKDPSRDKAIEPLRAGLTDTNPRVRKEFVFSMGAIISKTRRDCPNEIVVLLDDEDEEVRHAASAAMELFDTFPLGTVDRALNYHDSLAKDSSATEREFGFISILGRIGGKDPRVLKILQDGLDDLSPLRRNNCIVGLWAATKDFELVIPLYLNELEKWSALEPRGDDPPNLDAPLLTVIYLIFRSRQS